MIQEGTVTKAVLAQSRDSHTPCLHRLHLRDGWMQRPQGNEGPLPQDGLAGGRELCGDQARLWPLQRDPGSRGPVTGSTSELTEGALTD